MTLEEKLYSALSGDADLMGMVTDISYAYPLSFENLPVVDYYLNNGTPLSAFGGKVGDTSEFYIDIWSKSAMLNKQIGQKIEGVLMSIGDKTFEGDLFENEPQIHHKVMRFKLIG